MSIFVDHSTRHLRERKNKISFGNPFDLFNECITIRHEYSDDTEVEIYINSNSININFSHHGRHYQNMRVIIPFDYNDHPDNHFEYNLNCTGCCGGCPNMHECHDLG